MAFAVPWAAFGDTPVRPTVLGDTAARDLMLCGSRCPTVTQMRVVVWQEFMAEIRAPWHQLACGFIPRRVSLPDGLGVPENEGEPARAEWTTSSDVSHLPSPAACRHGLVVDHGSTAK